MSTRWVLVDTQKKLERAVKDFDKATILSIDTEYDSFRYFREKLCLIQIHAGNTTYVFDPLGDLNLSFLDRYFADYRMLKIFHAAENDIRLLKRDYHFNFHNIFDTHRAALLLGFQQLSLEKILLEFAGVELKKNKKIQRSRWDQRPLTDAQIEYAMQDVVFLPSLYASQSAELEMKGLKMTALEAFSKIAGTDWHEKKFNRRGYLKIQGYESLDDEKKVLFKRLYLWRFRRAREENRAVFMFLPDKNLLELALDAGHPERYLSQRKMKAYGAEVERIIRNI